MFTHVTAATGPGSCMACVPWPIHSLGDQLSWFPQDGGVFWDRGLSVLKRQWLLTFFPSLNGNFCQWLFLVSSDFEHMSNKTGAIDGFW